jgi:dUTP pyrophosphatase
MRNEMFELEVLYLSNGASPPFRAYEESAAYDLSACLLNDAGRPFTATIAPSTTKLIGTGLALRPPFGHIILVCSRSGFAANGVFVANAPGVVDPDYTGEIKIILYNGSLEPFYVRHKDRIAQALVVPFVSPSLSEVKEFPTTPRGTAGFGSTGT